MFLDIKGFAYVGAFIKRFVVKKQYLTYFPEMIKCFQKLSISM